MKYAIGLDIGGTNIKAVAIDPAGQVLEEQNMPTQDDVNNVWKSHARRLVEQIQQRRGAPAAWVGVCCPGIVARDGYSIWWMSGKMEGTVNFQWGPFLQRTQPVPVFNDAQAALLAEICCGAAQMSRNAVLLTLGTGVGGALWCEGRLLRGHLGRAGHLGHMSVDFNGPRDLAMTPGAIEYHMGNYSLQKRSHGRWTSTQELVQDYVRGDGAATLVWLNSIKALAAHVVSIVNAVDPEIVIIGGGIAAAGDHLFIPLSEMMDDFEWRPHGRQVRVVPAALGSEAGAVGAAYGAMQSEREQE